MLMKELLKMKSLIILFMFLLMSCAAKKENQEEEILKAILNTKKEIENYKIGNKTLCEDNNCIFLSFWDFDGTILKGDCSEGLKENGKEMYKGLVELGVLKGFAKDYKGQTGVDLLLKKYIELEANDKKEAYLYLPRIFAGNEDQVIRNFAREYFKETLQNYYFPSSIRILEKLKEEGVKSYIISASADFFVDGSYGTMPVEMDSIHGITMKIETGKITQEEIPPVTYAEGKREKIEQIVASIRREKKAMHVFILAGFGNSFGTDGPFLKYISEQKFQVGKPISVMINGGNAPVEFKGLFKEVSFDL